MSQLSEREQEAYDLVCKLNEELYGRFGDSEVDDVPGFSFTGNEYACAITWGETCVWDSESSSDYDDDDNLIPLESIVRKAVGQIATAAEWIARDHEREKVSLDHVLFFLNGLVKVDASAMEGLIEKRTICNEAMADHPTVQVQVPEQGPGFLLGFLGVLNGMFGAFAEGPKKGWGQIAAVFEQDGRLSGFRRTLDPQVRPGVYPLRRQRAGVSPDQHLQLHAQGMRRVRRPRAPTGTTR
jgi:hypothetical protein